MSDTASEKTLEVNAASSPERIAAARAALEALAPAAPIKPGHLTTEFLGKCVIQGIAILVLVGVIPTSDQAHAGDIALALIGAVEAAYGYGRSLVKSA